MWMLPSSFYVFLFSGTLKQAVKQTVNTWPCGKGDLIAMSGIKVDLLLWSEEEARLNVTPATEVAHLVIVKLGPNITK